MDTVRLKHISPSVLRIGIAAVFLWFGMSQVMDPAAWAGFVPDYVMAFTGIAVGTVVYWNGMFEIVFGSLLFFGLFTRFAALLLALHIMDIAYTVGLNAIGGRDFGLSVATVCVFLNGADRFSLDRFRAGDAPSS